MKKNIKYTDEFKETIIQLVLKSDKSIVKLSEEIGLCERTLYKWTYFERVTKRDFLNLVQERMLKEELDKTRQELKQAKREVDILSKILSKKI